MGEIGLFPLGIVLLPGERAPLHIFEPRYRELIAQCLEREASFGLVFDDDEEMRSVGTHAELIEVLERLPDGRSNILIRGGARFRIVRRTSGRSFLTAEVEPFEDEAPAGRPAEGTGGADAGGGSDPAADEVAACVARYRRLVELADVEPDELDLTAKSVAFEIASRVAFDADAKQELLEMRAEGPRVRRLLQLLDLAIEGLALQRTIRERAAGNGHVSG